MLALSILCFSLLVSFTNSFPLARRDVWAPKITSPNAETVWPVGTKQTVVWDTSNKPVNVTNPIGKVILGHMENDSLNLQLNDPLAQNFNLTDGKVQITVPNVPPRDDYLIVLMGDSGNTSPTFAITRISGGTPPTSSTTDTPNTSTFISTPIPISGTEITGGQTSTSTSTTLNTSSAPISSATTPSSSTSITSRLSDATSSSSAPATITSTNSAAALSNGMKSINGLLMCMAVMVLSLI